MSFSDAKQRFDQGEGLQQVLAQSIVPVDGSYLKNIKIRSNDGLPLEEYYKWQFISAITQSGMYPPDYVGAEVRFPKGNKTSAPIKLDAAIFDDPAWQKHYNEYWDKHRSEDIEWLAKHLLAVVEFKRGDKEIDKVFTGQVKPAMREKDPSNAYVMGVYYDAERLYLFHRRDGLCLRYDEGKNIKGDSSGVGDLSLHLPDPYSYLPSLRELRDRLNRSANADRSARTIDDLDIVTSIATAQVRGSLSDVLRVIDQRGLGNQRGYLLFIEALAMKVYDERRSLKRAKQQLEFYVADDESTFKSLAEPGVQTFIKRMQALRVEAESEYKQIFSGKVTDWKNKSHVEVVIEVCKAFQDYSFIRSSNNELYQLVFYNFANEFTRNESAQFLTPLPVIQFMVDIVNPREGETVIDPCCGIGDFLSLSFVHAQKGDMLTQLDDANLYGMDVNQDMITLARLNMLLNGDGEAKLFHCLGKGSIVNKVANGTPPHPVELLPGHHKGGNWLEWPDDTSLKLFDVVLTNPPFGEHRAYRPASKQDREIIEMYETWGISGNEEGIDLGVVFLENAYRNLKEHGRLGIVLSNSIASINKWQKVREWLAERMRLVALFDLPSNVFAETGVNTSILIAYKPSADEMEGLMRSNYSIFVRDIKRVGYQTRTVKRTVFFNPTYKIDPQNFEIVTDGLGKPVLDEEFSETIGEFHSWARGQEEVLQKLFLTEES